MNYFCDFCRQTKSERFTVHIKVPVGTNKGDEKHLCISCATEVRDSLREAVNKLRGR